MAMKDSARKEKKMKKAIVVSLLTVSLLFPVKGNAKVITKPRGFYPTMAMVTDIKAKRNGIYKISAVDAAGREWQWLDDSGDWYEGDFAALMMYDSHTKRNVYDDIVIDARYCGCVRFFMR